MEDTRYDALSARSAAREALERGSSSTSRPSVSTPSRPRLNHQNTSNTTATSAAKQEELLPQSQAKAERKPYAPITDEHKSRITRSLQNADTAFLTPTGITALTKDDFLTEDGYYSWLDHSSADSSGDGATLENVLVDMVKSWDIRYPLLHNPNNASASISGQKAGGAQTMVNLMVRIMEAQDLPLDSRGKPQNTFALFQYAGLPTTTSASTSQSGSRKKQEEIRYQTKVIPASRSPKWNQQITLTIKDLLAPIRIAIMSQKEKSGLFSSGELKEDELGFIELSVAEVVSKVAKKGYMSEWINLRSPKVGASVGKLLVEVEMSGIVDRQNAPSASVHGDDPSEPRELRRLRAIHHRLITHKVNLKQLYTTLLRYTIYMELCPSSSKQLFDYPLRKVPWKLTQHSLSLLAEFERIFHLSSLFCKMKYLECVFLGYKAGRIHARALLDAYKSVYDDVFRNRRVWLPEHEKPNLLNLMMDIEIYTTTQIKQFKEFFAIDKSLTGDRRRDVVEHIGASLDCVVLLTRMIDKNDLFLSDVERQRIAENTEEGQLAGVADLGRGSGRGAEDEYEDDGIRDVFAEQEKYRRGNNSSSASGARQSPQPAASSTTPTSISAALERKAAITEYDYKDGKFRFSEKLHGILQSRAVLRYQHLAEEATPPLASSDTLETTLFKCREIAVRMLEDIEEDKEVYARGFKGEKFDLVGCNVETYVKFFVLEMENLRGFVRERVLECGGGRLVRMVSDEIGAGKTNSQMSLESAGDPASTAAPAAGAGQEKIDVTGRVPESEQDIVYLAMDLMHCVARMRNEWSAHLASSHALHTSGSEWFSPFIKRFLDLTVRQAVRWAQQAVQMDKFDPDSVRELANRGEMHSSSVTDLYTAIYQSLELVKQAIEALGGSEGVRSIQQTQLLTRFASVGYEAMKTYCEKMEALPLDVLKLDQKSVGEAVWNFFSRQQQQEPDETEVLRQQVQALNHLGMQLALRLANLDAMLARLKGFYNEIDGRNLTEETGQWRKRKKQAMGRSSSSSRGDGVTAVLRVRVIQVENLKGRSGFTSTGKTNPYFVIKRQVVGNEGAWEEVSRSNVVTDTSNPLFTIPLPPLSGSSRPVFLMDSGQYVFAVQDATELQICVHHFAEASVFTQWGGGSPSSTNGPVLGEVTIPISQRRFYDARGSYYEMVDLLPQGKMLVHLEMKSEGVSGLFKGASTRNSLDEQVHFGPGGVEDLEFWFLKMKARLGNARHQLLCRALGELNAVVSPRMHRLITESAAEIGDGGRHLMEQLADRHLGPVVDTLNQVLSVYTSRLPDYMAQYVVYHIWIRCFLYPALNYLHPTPFYLSIAASANGQAVTNTPPLGSSSNGSGSVLDGNQERLLTICMSLLMEFFYADGEGLGLDRELLKNSSGFCPHDLSLGLQLARKLFGEVGKATNPLPDIPRSRSRGASGSPALQSASASFRRRK